MGKTFSLVKKVKNRLKNVFNYYRRNSLYSVKPEVKKLIKKRQFPELTKQQKEEIDRYWAQFGIRFRDYSYHRMFYGATGICNPGFIPAPLAYAVLYPHYNNNVRGKLFSDKNFFQALVPTAGFPRTFGKRVNGYYFDENGKYLCSDNIEVFIDSVFNAMQKENATDIVIKQTIDTQTGLGVKKFSVNSREELAAVLSNNFGKDYIIQIAIRQHPALAQFNSSSVNIIRCTTWRNGDKVHLFAPCLRYGIPGAVTDVSFVDGEEILNGIGVKEDGTFMDYSVNQNGERTPVSLEYKSVPNWDALCKQICEAHLSMVFHDVIAWDMTVDENGDAVCIEYNVKCPGSQLYQFVHGPMAGEHTDEYLGFLKNPEMQKRYLPPKIRA